MKAQIKLFSAVLLVVLCITMTGCGGGDTVVRQGTVNGRVVRAADGMGVTGAGIIVGGKPGVTDAAGYYVVLKVPIGIQALAVTAAGYAQPGGPILVQINPGDNYVPTIVLVQTGGGPPDPPTS